MGPSIHYDDWFWQSRCVDYPLVGAVTVPTYAVLAAWHGGIDHFMSLESMAFMSLESMAFVEWDEFDETCEMIHPVEIDEWLRLAGRSGSAPPPWSET